MTYRIVKGVTVVAAAALLCFTIPPVRGAESPATSPTEKGKEKAAPSPAGPPVSGETAQKEAVAVMLPLYRPPSRGAPGGRVGGGTRGDDQVFTLSVLAPDHIGRTFQDQPTLYWYVSKPLSGPIEFTLIDESETPLVEKTLAPSTRLGIQRLPLSEIGVRLERNKQYQWFLAIVVDPKRRAKDVLAGAMIERHPLPESLAAQASVSDRMSAAHIYAKAGHWYDAIQMLSEQVRETPQDSTPRRHRAALLQQVGLQEIAEYDMNHEGD